MWWRSASFVLDKGRNEDVQAESDSLRLSPSTTSMADTVQNPNPKVSAYYETRAAHHAVVTSDWLAQAQAAVGQHPDDLPSPKVDDSGKPFSVIDEFNCWRKQPDLAEAVAAIRALASVIRSSQATTMMELEIELKKASDSLKVSAFYRNAGEFLVRVRSLKSILCFEPLLLIIETLNPYEYMTHCVS